MNRLVIATDLDGTLLDHVDYNCDVSKPLLAQLAANEIPVILNTSKTAAEIKRWREELGLNFPAIIENGSALIDARGETHIYGASMADLGAFLDNNSPPAINFVTCAESTAEQLTGLKGEALAAARHREYSVPLKFDSIADAEGFQQIAKAQRLQCVRGGRFYTLQGWCNKGTTLQHYLSQLEQSWQCKLRSIVLGDNMNDLSMLEKADIAVVVKSENGEYQVEPRNQNTIYVEKAPMGWVDGVQQALNKLGIELT